MEELVRTDFAQRVKLLCYADDLQLVIQGAGKMHKAQRALALLNRKCTMLRLKINPQKTKAMSIKDKRPDCTLSIQNTEIDWVDVHQCLGIFIDRKLVFAPHTDYLKERMSTRICAMR